jgi:hypothetical protein
LKVDDDSNAKTTSIPRLSFAVMSAGIRLPLNSAAEILKLKFESSRRSRHCDAIMRFSRRSILPLSPTTFVSRFDSRATLDRINGGRTMATAAPEQSLRYERNRLPAEDELTALRDENRQLRELVIQLSKLVVKNVVERK